MGRSLVIVESPTKAKTINKYVGGNYSVKASFGHVMDLPKKTLGIVLPGDEDYPAEKKRKASRKPKAASNKVARKTAADESNIFEPHYEAIPGKTKIINDLRKAASSAEMVYLAADPDREGEAICAHLAMVSSKPGRFALAEPAEEGNAKKDKD